MPDDLTVEDEFQITIDGKVYTAEDMSFREQRTLRTMVRELMDDPEGDIADADMMDFAPALICIIKRRDVPEFTVEEALDMNMGDVFRPANGNGPPTKARAKPKAKATT